MFELSLWQEKFTLDEAVQRMQNTGLPVQPLVREIGKTLLINKCMREFDIEPPNEEQRENILSNLKAQMKLSSDEAFESWLKKQNLTQEQLLKNLSLGGQLNRLKEVTVPEEALKQEFLKVKSANDQLVFAMIRVETKDKAEELYAELKKDSSRFNELAKEHSVGPEAPNGGVVGPRTYESLNPELRQRLRKMSAGDFSEPFTLDEKQYVLIRVEKVLPFSINPQVKQQMRERLFEQWVDRQLKMGGLSLAVKEEANV